MDPTLAATLASHLADPAVAWSLGSFGAIAEFMWHDGEAAVGGDLLRVTSRGGIGIAPPPHARAVPTATPTRGTARRLDGLAICLAEADCAMGERATITELGPDAAALREEDRETILFDMGLAQKQVDVMVRSRDPETLALLRAAAGRSLFDPSQGLMAHLPRLSPHRVFASRCGRIEVYAAIPPPDGLSPDGPHTHVLPKLLRHGRTHAANLGIPDGLVPCLSLHFARPDPAHAVDRDGDTDDAEAAHDPR